MIISELSEPEPLPLLQWSTYDEISHALTLTKPRSVLSSTYVIRKSLIRKHFLHRSIQEYVAKHAESILKRSVPLTWGIEVQWADELDEMWSDELYELGQSLPETTGDIEDEEKLQNGISSSQEWPIVEWGSECSEPSRACGPS
jgi:tubulin--tyrosine ligase